ncbi:MAG: hypothetical protein COB06_002345 [Pseudomonas sp.]|uniref:hypothetical protein n=1 Tax=Pseudomonas sp. TaxID=306 RepID=UPI0025F9F757|nr:hypothetical protein [Pseudomonas sp.]MBL1306073.1 hypothetical protein [Pseudomonas sp.]
MSSIEFATSLIFSIVGLLAITFISKSIEINKRRKREEAQLLGHNLEFIDEIISSLPTSLLDNALSTFLKQRRQNYLSRMSQTGIDTPAGTLLTNDSAKLPQDPRKLLDLNRTLKSLGKYLVRCEQLGTLSKATRVIYQQSLDKSASRVKVQQHWQQASKALKEGNPEYALHNYGMCLQQLSRHKRTVVDQQMMDKIQQKINAIKGDNTAEAETDTQQNATATTSEAQAAPVSPSKAEATAEPETEEAENVQDWGEDWKKKTVYD